MDDATRAPARISVQPAPQAAEPADPRIPPRDRVVTRDLIDRLAREQPEKTFAVFDDDGETWSYARFRELVVQTALGLQGLGVGLRLRLGVAGRGLVSPSLVWPSDEK